MRSFIVALLFVLFSGSAFASCPSLTNLTNGTTADANQVMGNFNALLNCFNASATNIPRSYLAGLTLANDATSPNTAIDVAVGVATSDDATTSMPVATAVAKNANAAWLVGTGSGCLDTGSSLSPSTWYHVFIIERTDTSVVDVLCSTSVSAPSLPANYTKKRRIGSFLTNGTSLILAFTQNGDEVLWKTFVQNVAATTTSSTAASKSVTTPPGVECWALLVAFMAYNNAATNLDLYALDTGTQVNNSPIGWIKLSVTSTLNANSGSYTVRTNTSSQVGVVATGSGGVYYLVTEGYIDRRGRDN